MGTHINFFNENEKINNFGLSVSKKLSKTDKSVIKLIMQNYKDNVSEVSRMKLKSLSCNCICEDIKTYLDKLLQIKVSYSFNNSDDFRCEGSFNLIDSYFIQKDKVIFLLSKNPMLSLDKLNIFKEFSLKTVFNFESTSSLPMYLRFLNLESFGEENHIDFSLDELKEFLEITNCYERFYDFEKKILEPIINDLNVYSEFQVKYEKIKKASTASSKITGIRIIFYSKKLKEVKIQVNDLMNLIKSKINDFEHIYQKLFYYLKNYGYDYVHDNINYALVKKEGKNFDVCLIKALENNLGYIQITHEEHNNIVIEKTLNNTYELHSELYKAIQKLETDKTSDNHMFLSSFISKIYQMKDGENFVIEKNGIRIELLYNKLSKSRIEISML